ncbi:MAG: hypothetical protein WCD31_14315 [Gillisia sp.]
MKKFVLVTASLFCLSTVFTSCRQVDPDHDAMQVSDDAGNIGNDAEKTGNDVGNSLDKAANDTGDAIDKAANDVGDAVDTSAKKVKDELNGTDDN